MLLTALAPEASVSTNFTIWAQYRCSLSRIKNERQERRLNGARLADVKTYKRRRTAPGLKAPAPPQRGLQRPVAPRGFLGFALAAKTLVSRAFLFGPVYFRSYGGKAFYDVFVASFYLVDVAYHAFSFGAHRGYNHSHARPHVRACKHACGKFRRA